MKFLHIFSICIYKKFLRISWQCLLVVQAWKLSLLSSQSKVLLEVWYINACWFIMELSYIMELWFMMALCYITSINYGTYTHVFLIHYGIEHLQTNLFDIWIRLEMITAASAWTVLFYRITTLLSLYTTSLSVFNSNYVLNKSSCQENRINIEQSDCCFMG